MRRNGQRPARPTVVFDQMLQVERTALAWERTAIASIVAGALLTRHAATIHIFLAVLGIAQVLTGAALLVWTGRHYDDLHQPLNAGDSPVHPTAAKIVGLTTVIFTGAATVIVAATVLF